MDLRLFYNMDFCHPHNNLNFLCHQFLKEKLKKIKFSKKNNYYILNDPWALFIHFPFSLVSIMLQAHVNQSGYLTKTRVPLT
jgi:hypothetical protein